MASRLIWHGDKILAKVREATRLAGDAVLIDATAQAKVPGWTPRDTGALANSITYERMQRAGSGLVGSFGSYDVHYAIYVEVGTYKMAGHHYLRRARDAVFPSLPERVAEFYR